MAPHEEPRTNEKYLSPPSGPGMILAMTDIPFPVCQSYEMKPALNRRLQNHYTRLTAEGLLIILYIIR